MKFKAERLTFADPVFWKNKEKMPGQFSPS